MFAFHKKKIRPGPSIISSKSVEPTQSRLLTISYDTLELIINEISGTESSKEDFQNLSLVCHSTNDLVAPYIFSAVTIDFGHGLPILQMKERLVRLASNKSPACKHAKTLHIRCLFPMTPSTYQWEQARFTGKEYEGMVEFQKRYLKPAIESLKNIRSVEWMIRDREPYQEILGTIFSFPLLRNLNMVLNCWNETIEVEFPIISKDLRTLCLSGSSTLSASMSKELQKAIANSTNLSHLELLVKFKAASSDTSSPSLASTSTRFSLGELTRDAVHASVNYLRLSVDCIALTASSIPFLKSLKTLDLATGNYSTEIEQSFWKEMSAAGIQLEVLILNTFSKPVNVYLQSYTGLRELSIAYGKETWDSSNTKGPSSLFLSVLSHHKETLTNFTIQQSALGPWCITEAYLDQVLLCRKLKFLGLSYHFSETDKQKDTIKSLSKLIRPLPHGLPHLTNLAISPTRSFPTSFGCGFARGQYFSHLAGEFADCIEAIELGPRVERTDLEISSVGLKFQLEPRSGDATYRFVRVTTPSDDPY